jgi:hypothetical protein
MMMTDGAAPCLGCDTTGGYRAEDEDKPRRHRGLCWACEQLARARNSFYQYPACGPVPIVRLAQFGESDMWRPAPWATRPALPVTDWSHAAPAPFPTTEAQRKDSGALLWSDGDGDRPRRWPRALRPRCSPAAVVAEAEAFAADWLHRHSPAEAA